MQVTINTVTLPTVVLDAYLEQLNASIGPILAEEDLVSKAQHALLERAIFACSKSICMKFSKEIEEAGLFQGVISIDYPGFKWNSGLKFIYAVDQLTSCIVKSFAEEMIAGKERDLSMYFDFLVAWREISIDKATCDMMEHVEGPTARRLEEHALGLATVNARLMVGETPNIIIQTLHNVRDAISADKDPVQVLATDMEYLVPSVTSYL